MSDRDPVQEAVERAFLVNGPCAPEGCLKPGQCECRVIAQNWLAAALAPYGGLGAIRKLEEDRVLDKRG